MIGGLGLVLGLLGLGGLVIKGVVSDAVKAPTNSPTKKKEWDFDRQLSLQMHWKSEISIMSNPSYPFYCSSYVEGHPETLLEMGYYPIYEKDIYLLKEVLPQPYFDMLKYYGISFELVYGNKGDKFALALAQKQMLNEGYNPPACFYEMTLIEPFIKELKNKYPEKKLKEMLKKVSPEDEVDRFFYMDTLSPFTPECMAECAYSMGNDLFNLTPLNYAYLKWRSVQPPIYGVEDPQKYYRSGKMAGFIRESIEYAYIFKDIFWLQPEHLKPEYRDMYKRLIPRKPKNLDL